MIVGGLVAGLVLMGKKMRVDFVRGDDATAVPGALLQHATEIEVRPLQRTVSDCLARTAQRVPRQQKRVSRLLVKLE